MSVVRSKDGETSRHEREKQKGAVGQRRSERTVIFTAERHHTPPRITRELRDDFATVEAVHVHR